MTEEQAAILVPTMQDLSVKSILKDAGGTGANKKKLAQRKLNNASAITNQCGLQNHPEPVNKLLAAASRRCDARKRPPCAQRRHRL